MDGLELKLAVLAPRKELGGRLEIGRAGISVADLRGEELQKVFAGPFAGLRQEDRNGKRRGEDGKNLNDGWSYEAAFRRVGTPSIQTAVQ